MTTLLTREQILSANDLKTESVPVPEWGGTVLVATMTGAQRDAFYERQAGEKVPYSQFSASVIVSTVVDEAGAPLFQPADIDALRARSQAAMDRVLAVALRLNGLAPQAVEEAKKNSDSIQSADSGSV